MVSFLQVKTVPGAARGRLRTRPAGGRGAGRRSSAPRRRFVQMTIGLTAISCVLPAAFADTTASKFAMVALHLVAAAIIVPVLARHAD
jgi:hypothetical protein